MANTDAARILTLFLNKIVSGQKYSSHPLMFVLVYFCRDVTVGDIVTVGECRPLSKTVRFNVLKVTKAAGAKKQFQKF